MRTTNIVQTTQSSHEISENAIAMGIDEASSVFLMDALGKLYARPAQAALREYLSNAIDAHNAKGGNLPAVQITLPTGSGRNSKLLLVRDFGKGMTEKEFETILSRYGASTKRDSNKQIGGFGLGAKSGFAVSNEFFMTSYQQGKGFRVRIFKDALNQGYVDVVERFATAEPDGMLVEVPIPDGNLYELSHAALAVDIPFFAGYAPDEISVTPAGSYASQSVHNTKLFAPLNFAGSTTGWIRKVDAARVMDRKTYAMIGGVVYPLDMNNLTKLAEDSKVSDQALLAAISLIKNYNRTTVINIPIGSVDLPSSREEIIYSERSLRTINASIINFAMLMENYFQKVLNTKKTRRIALDYYLKLEEASFSGARELSWQGQKSPLSDEVRKSSYLRHFSIRNGRVQSSRGSVMDFEHLKEMSSKSSYPRGIFRFVFTTAHDLAAAAKLPSEVFGDFVDGASADTRFNALIIFTVKGEELNDWMFNFKEVDPIELQVVLAKQREKAKEQKELERKREQKEAAQRMRVKKAKDTRSLGMLSNFTITDSAGRTISRNTTENVFKDIKVKKYYWSEEQILKLGGPSTKKLTQAHNLLFPFIATNMANNFEIAYAEADRYHRENLLVKLRKFMGLFFAKGSRIIILDKGRDLAEFLSEHPEVESGVEFLKTKLAEQIEDSSSNLMLAYSALAAGNNIWAWKLADISNILSGFTPEQESRLPSDLTLLRTNFGVVAGIKRASTDLKKVWLDAYAKSFKIDLSKVKEAPYSVEAGMTMVKEKYPLLAHGTFTVKADGLMESMMDYLVMCDSKESK